MGLFPDGKCKPISDHRGREAVVFPVLFLTVNGRRMEGSGGDVACCGGGADGESLCCRRAWSPGGS